MSQEIVPWAGPDETRTFSVEQRRCLYWRWATGGENREEAAEVAGVSRVTIFRWLARPDFRAAWDDAESWAKHEIRTQRNTLELKSLHMAHTLLDSVQTSDGVKADVLAKALTDVRQTKQLALEAGQTQLWAAMLDTWEARSKEILGTHKDGAQTEINATIAGVEDEGQTDEG